MMAAPPPAKFATARNYDRPTLGPLHVQVAEIVTGKPFMPWQRQVSDVICELSLDAPGEWQYLEGDITVPRQSGKSHWLKGLHIARLLIFQDHKAMMTAQTGRDAGKRWSAVIDGLNLATGDRAADWKVKRGKGNEELLHLGRGSSLAPFAPTPDAIHGDTLNDVSIDEEWAFTLAEGKTLEDAIKPTFATSPNPQLIRVSTMGTANSTYMNHNVALGRQAVKDPGSRRFFFEWSADEDAVAADPYSDAALAFHPALGHTQTARRLRDLGKDLTLGQWRRSYLNLLTQTKETAINLASLDATRWNYAPDATDRYRPERGEDMVLAWDIAADSSGATIVAGWLDSDGDPATEQVMTAPGTDWLLPAIRELAGHGFRAIVADHSGPNMTIIAEMETQQLPVTSYKFADYGAACQSLLDRLKSGKFTHDGSSELTAAAEIVATKKTSTATVFDPAKSVGPIDALRAHALAQYAASSELHAPVMQLFT